MGKRISMSSPPTPGINNTHLHACLDMLSFIHVDVVGWTKIISGLVSSYLFFFRRGWSVSRPKIFRQLGTIILIKSGTQPS
jgi:hypothetical protein